MLEAVEVSLVCKMVLLDLEVVVLAVILVSITLAVVAGVCTHQAELMYGQVVKAS